ncbi:MAG TPA: hypothetical protein VHA37_04390 [Candidatus Saccharimonadales bacterium]|nr:hypothetical protein [Candidatus Saccharimonadales bacterium]
MKRPNPRAEQGKVEAWNAVHAVGTVVDVRLDNGSTLRTKTVAPASLLGGHTAVAWLEDISGAYRLDRCTAVRPEPGRKEAA